MFLTRLAVPILCTLSIHGLFATDSVNTDMSELVQQIRQLDNLSSLIQKEYIKPISREEIWNGAIRGMIESLDKHSLYFTKDETALYGGTEADRGRGFGFDWFHDANRNEIIISRVIPGSSAEANNIVAGDVLLSINDKHTDQFNRTQIRRMLMTAPNEINLKLRQADKQLLQVSLERSDFTDSGVIEHRLLNKHIAYVKVSRFRDGSLNDDEENVEGVARTLTGKAFRQQLDILETKDVKALIVDLRGNGGGSIRAAVEVADCFLNAGPNEPVVIVEQVSRNNIKRSFAYTASSVNTYPHWPLCVLVDQHTASSAEIVAAAWQDHHRAIVIGEPSAGKTTIQETFILNDGSSIRLSVAHYQTPNGQKIQDHGLQPDVQAKQSQLNHLQLQRRALLIKKGLDVPENLKRLKDPVIDQGTAILTGVLVYQDKN